MSEAPRRIVSLVPSSTESVAVLAGAERIVGCTRYCREPAGRLDHATRIGGTKNPDVERVLALRPDLVLANAEENRAEDLEYLGARVRTLVQTPCTVAACRDALAELAAVLDAVDAVRPFVAELDQAVARDVSPRLRVLYLIWRKPWMSINRTTYIHDVLRVAGAVNVAADHAERYPTLAEHELAAAGIDAVLLPDEPWVFDAAQREALLAARTFGRATATLCDGRDFCWHGVRAAAGVRRVAELLAGLAPAH
ncbi:MAG: hypothetical protein RL398_3600 [Planctomycetota bacterium]